MPEKSPNDVEGVAGSRTAARSRGIDTVDADFLDFAQFRDDVREARAAAGDDDLRRTSAEAGDVVAGDGIPSGQRVDVVGLAGGVAVDDEGVAHGAFCSAVDDIAAVGRSRRIGVPDDRVVSGTAVDRVRAGVEAGHRDVDREIVDVEVVAVIPVVAVARGQEADCGGGADLIGSQGCSKGAVAIGGRAAERSAGEKVPGAGRNVPGLDHERSVQPRDCRPRRRRTLSLPLRRPG